MNKQYVTVLLAVVCILGMGVGAHALEQDTVVTKVPFDFVVGNQVLPAGTYRIERVQHSNGSRALEISNDETRDSVFVTTSVFDDHHTGYPQLSFEHIGDTYLLDAIKTPIGTYAVTVFPSAVKLAQMEQRSEEPSGSN